MNPATQFVTPLRQRMRPWKSRTWGTFVWRSSDHVMVNQCAGGRFSVCAASLLHRNRHQTPCGSGGDGRIDEPFARSCPTPVTRQCTYAALQQIITL